MQHRAKALAVRAVAYGHFAANRLKARREGYSVVNPWRADYTHLRGRYLENAIREVIGPFLPRGRVGAILDIGCGDGQRVAPALKAFADRVVGIDLFAPEQVSNCDQYIRADLARPEALLESLPDRSIDVAMVFNFTGMHPTSTWQPYFSPTNDRLWPYLQHTNLPRVLTANGLLVVIEWEAYPEKRVGRRTLDEVNRDYAALYAPVDVAGFERVGQGFSPRLFSPYIVFRRTGPA